jgi:integrase
MSVKVREKRGKLYLDIYQGGKRTWESLHLTLTKDREQNKHIWQVAEVCRSKRETQLLTGAWGIQDPTSSKITLVKHLEDVAKGYANPKIIGSIIYHLKLFKNGSTIQLIQITPQWVQDFEDYFMAKVRKEEMAQTTAADYTHIFRAAMVKAVNAGLILHDPCAGVPTIKALETEMVFLGIDEIRLLAAVPKSTPYDNDVRRAFLFSCYTGLRVSDLETLTWEKIETSSMQIIKSQKKTKHPVYMPMAKQAQRLIIDGKEHKPDDKVFPLLTQHIRRLSYSHLNKWAQAAGVKKHIGWHTARRTFATMALENGTDPVTVAKLLGHSDLDQVMRYAKVTDKRRREAVDGLPSINPEPTVVPVRTDPANDQA